MIKYGDTISSQTTGQPIYGAQVTVLNAQGLQATIYSDEAGTIPLSQPILTDQSGYFSFYIDDGRYNVVVMAGQAEIARTNITMVDTLGIKQRALLVPVNEDGGTIAPADARKGMVLAFDATTGAPSAVLPNEFAGPTGPANSTYTSLAALKAAPQSNRSYILADGTNSPVTYAYVAGDFTGRADDVNVVKLDAVPLTTGALVRQSAAGVTFQQVGTTAITRNVQDDQRENVKVTQYGAKGDGVTDDSAAIMACINANKGKTIVFPQGYTFLAAGIILSGSTYNGTRLVVEGTLKLASNIDGTELGRMNFQTTWCLVVFHDCEGVSIDVPGMLDGNRADMTTTREQILLLCLAGARKGRVDRFNAREVRGDGIYISIANFFAASTNTSDFTFGLIDVTNSDHDGRNAVSLISGENLSFVGGKSWRVGGIVRGIRQPGGFDIEPDNGVLHKVSNVAVGPWNVYSIGTTGMAVLGQPATPGGRDWNVTYVTISDFLVRNPSDIYGGGPVIWGVRALRISGRLTRDFRGGIIEIADGDDITADISMRNCGNGFTVGARSVIRDSDLNLSVLDFSATAVHIIRASGCRITGDIANASQAGATGMRISASGTTVENTKISINQRTGNFEHTGVVSGGGSIAPTTYLADCEMTGFTSFAKQCTAQIASVNVKNRNDAPSIPTSGSFFIGDEVRNNSTISYGAGKKYLRGWRRIQTGSNNSVDVDWAPMYVTGE